jgi:hypothetical protein
MKHEIRILALDDASYSKEDKKVFVVGVVYRGGSYIDGLLTFSVRKDGSDATEKLVKILGKTRHKGQLQYIMIKGITLAGFNFFDIKEIYERTGKPVIVVMRKRPNMKRFIRAFENINPVGIEAVENAGEIRKVNVKGKKLFVQKAGLNNKDVKKILEITCLHSNIPEPLRVSHLIASGISRGENKARA